METKVAVISGHEASLPLERSFLKAALGPEGWDSSKLLTLSPQRALAPGWGPDVPDLLVGWWDSPSFPPLENVEYLAVSQQVAALLPATLKGFERLPTGEKEPLKSAVLGVDALGLAWDTEIYAQNKLAEPFYIRDFEKNAPLLKSIGKVPLGVAGADDASLLAFVFLVLEAETGPGAVDLLRIKAAEGPAAVGIADGRVLPQSPLAPLVTRLKSWQAQGLLAANWMDWGLADLDNAAQERSIASSIRWMSQVLSLPPAERQFLKFQRFPFFADRTDFCLVSRIWSAKIPVAAWNPAGAQKALEVLLSADNQAKMTEEFWLASSRLETPPPNQTVRELSQWISAATRVIPVPQLSSAGWQTSWSPVLEALRNSCRFNTSSVPLPLQR